MRAKPEPTLPGRNKLVEVENHEGAARLFRIILRAADKRRKLEQQREAEARK
jgi:hypothetical protein